MRDQLPRGPAVNADDVKSRADLSLFLDELARRAETEASDWENGTVPRYLSAASGWVRDMHGWFKNIGEEMPTEPTWSLVAHIFKAACEYE